MIRSLTFAAFVAVFALSSPATADDAQGLRAALQAAEAGDWDAATARAQALGELSADIVTWRRLRESSADFADYFDFLNRHPDWPG